MADRRQLIRSLCRKGVLDEGPLTFDGVMRGGVALGHFKKFCLQDLSTEPLLFWLEAHEYAGIKSADFLGATARRLLSKYIAPGAPMAVAISDRLRLEATEAVEGGRASASTFDAVLQSVDNSLRYDVFPRFCQSDWCAQLVAMQVEASAVIGVGDFDLCRFLGAGGFGMVLLCRRRDTKKYYALKVIDKRIVISQKQVRSRRNLLSPQSTPRSRRGLRRRGLTVVICRGGARACACRATRSSASARCWRAWRTPSSSRCSLPSRRTTTCACASTSSRAATCTAT